VALRSGVDYRGVDLLGGGYPGTFQDVAMATDMLAKAAPRYHLSSKHIVAVGHSAGGQLAMWLATRPGIARTSALYTDHPLRSCPPERLEPQRSTANWISLHRPPLRSPLPRA